MARGFATISIIYLVYTLYNYECDICVFCVLSFFIILFLTRYIYYYKLYAKTMFSSVIISLENYDDNLKQDENLLKNNY